jgi:type 1 fimbria pilin
MKKGIFIVLSVVIFCRPCFSGETAQVTGTNNKVTVQQLFADFGKEKKTIHIKVGGFAMALARVFSDTKGVSEIDVYSLDECTKETKEKFNLAIQNIKDKSYETLVSTSEKNERVKVLVKIKDDCVREIVIVAGGNDPALVKIKGKIKPEDIQSIVDENKNK